ncbi:MAG: hypothetical protein M3O71_14785 [Bacteroidota bacterium]|nr:hypothetical protein [Bacteroidota bacterium]
MILQVITPEKETFNMKVSLPQNYLGKEVHCLFYIEEEAKSVPVSAISNKRPSDFFGILNPQESESFEKHIQQIRNEWDRNI